MKKNIKIKNLKDTELLAKKMVENIFKNAVICLNGDLGAGKTAFTKAFAKELGINETITSPTFTIVKEYESKFDLYHMDVYRIEENYELGIEEYFSKGGICIIEWSDLIKNILPQNRIEITITTLGINERLFSIISYGDEYDQLCNKLK